MVRYGCLDWAPTYLREAQGYDIKQAGWAYFAYEFAAIPGTLICGWLSDKVFHGRRALPTILFMAIVAVFIFLYWQFSSNYVIVTTSLIAIGFFIYGPVMLIGVQALDLAPKNAAGTAAGLTGFFGYFLGTAILANIVLGNVADAAGWDWTFILLITQELRVEPHRNASREATVVRGTRAKSESKLSETGLLPGSSGSGSMHTRPDITATNALRANASHITRRALR